jgi:hypothetical protein
MPAIGDESEVKDIPVGLRMGWVWVGNGPCPNILGWVLGKPNPTQISGHVEGGNQWLYSDPHTPTQKTHGFFGFGVGWVRGQKAGLVTTENPTQTNPTH